MENDTVNNETKKFALLESYVQDFNENITSEQILLKIPKQEYHNSLLYAITDKRIIEIKRIYCTDFTSWVVNSINRKHLDKFFIKKHFFRKLYNILFIPHKNIIQCKNTNVISRNIYKEIIFNNIDYQNTVKIKEIMN